MVVQRSEDFSQVQLVQAALPWHTREQAAQLVTEVSTSGLWAEENLLPEMGQPENSAGTGDMRRLSHLLTYLHLRTLNSASSRMTLSVG